MYTRYDEDALGAEALVSLQFNEEPIDLAHAEELEHSQRGWLSGAAQATWGEVPMMEEDEVGESIEEVIRDIRFA